MAFKGFNRNAPIVAAAMAEANQQPAAATRAASTVAIGSKVGAA